MLHWSCDRERSSIAFGESYDHIKRCNKAIDLEEKEYSCSLEGLKIGNNTIDTPTLKDVNFDSRNSLITASDSTGKALFLQIIQLSQGKCQEKEDQSLTVLLCEKEVDVTAFPDIQLKIQEVTLVIKWRNVFKWSHQKGCMFLY